jgi:hypothetical protein
MHGAMEKKCVDAAFVYILAFLSVNFFCSSHSNSLSQIPIAFLSSNSATQSTSLHTSTANLNMTLTYRNGVSIAEIVVYVGLHHENTQDTC